MKKEIVLSDDEAGELKNSLLMFVRRVASGIEGVPGEAQILPEVVRLLLGIGDSRFNHDACSMRL